MQIAPAARAARHPGYVSVALDMFFFLRLLVDFQGVSHHESTSGVLPHDHRQSQAHGATRAEDCYGCHTRLALQS